jgi:transposase
MNAQTLQEKPGPTPKPIAYAATIGVDWADQKHDLWIQPAGAAKPEHRILEHTPEAIHEWVAALRERFPEQSVAIAIETSRGALVHALHAYDFIVIYPINPKMLHSYRESFRVSGAKDDRTDAMLLEEYVRFHAAKLRPLWPDTTLTRKLGMLAEKRRELVDHRTRLVNTLHSLLKTYYPLAETLFEDFTAPILSAFLLKWPELAGLQKTSAARLRAFFYAQHSRNGKKIQERLELIAKAKALTTDPALIEPSSFMAKTYAGLLQVLQKAIAQIDKDIQESFDQHPDAPLFRSFPGAGPVMAPRLLVAYGTDRERFQNAQEVQQLYGIAPVKKQSGKSRVIHMRYRCPKFGRQSFHENAGQAMKQDGWTRNYYEQQRAAKKGHHASLRSLAFKLIRIQYACWKENRPYDPAVYEKALRAHGTTLLATPQTSGPQNGE